MLKMGLLKKYVFTHCQPFPIQDWLSSDPQDMKELLDKLTQQNQQLAQLEAQIQVRICSCDINYAVFLLHDVMNNDFCLLLQVLPNLTSTTPSLFFTPRKSNSNQWQAVMKRVKQVWKMRTQSWKRSYRLCLS